MIRRPQHPAEIMIVGDTSSFSRVIATLIADTRLGSGRVRYATYESFRGMLNPRLLKETDLFILDLWRTYSTGLRAEGLAVAEELMRLHCKALVVSPLSLPPETTPFWYWDLLSTEPLNERCARLLTRNVRLDNTQTIEHLRHILQDYLDKPQSHDCPAIR